MISIYIWIVIIIEMEKMKFGSPEVLTKEFNKDNYENPM